MSASATTSGCRPIAPGADQRVSGSRAPATAPHRAPPHRIRAPRGPIPSRPSIPAALLETVRERARITDLFHPAALRRIGSEFLTLCPWHDDRNASLTVSPRTNRVHCFVCNKGADPIGWLQESQGLSFVEAVQELARRYAVPLPEQDPAAAARATADHQERQRLRQWRSRQEEEFHQALLHDLQSAGLAASYLKQRGISPETASAWRLGLHAQRLMLPIRDSQGRCCGFSGRSLDGQEPKYRNSAGDLLFQKSALLYGLDRAAASIRRRAEALLVEGPLDVIQLHQAGIDHAVAALGTALSSEQLQRLQRLGLRRLWLAYDGDTAGAKASGRLISLARPLLLQGHLDLQVVPLPPGDDPDSLLRRQGVEGLRDCLARGRHWLQWELDQLLAALQRDPEDLSVLQRCEMQAAALLAELPPGALRRKAEQRLGQAFGGQLSVQSPAGKQPLSSQGAQPAQATGALHGSQQRSGGDGEERHLQGDGGVGQAERRALRLFLCHPGLRQVLSVLELTDPLHREAMGWLWCLEQRLRGRDAAPTEAAGLRSLSTTAPSEHDGLRAAVIAAMPAMDPPLAELLSTLVHCGEPVRARLAAHPEAELVCILNGLEGAG